jgi:hypothetical protein
LRLLYIISLSICAVGACAPPAAAALPAPGAETAVEVMPPPAEVFTASRVYPAWAVARTNHAGWTESTGYANQPQEIRVRWHTDPGGQAVLQSRSAWDPRAPVRELGRWGRGTGQPERGTARIRIEEPTLLWLRVRAPKFPRAGVSSLRADFDRRTVAVLRGPAGSPRRPVILAEGYDPFNELDYNDPAWQEDATFAQLIAGGRSRYGLDAWIVDWGDAGAAMEQQAEDFAEIAREVRDWNGGKRETVAVGISMGAVTLRRALAAAADARQNLGVRKYVSINGPHRGAWINPDLMRFILKRLNRDRKPVEGEDPDTLLLGRAVGSPAAQQLLIGGRRQEAFFETLRSLGTRGYDPSIERVAFSNGTLVREGEALAELVQGEKQVAHRILMRPLWLPFWFTIRKTYRDFRYSAYPGELLPASLRPPVRRHKRFLGIFRFDFSARWERIPTFIPTHSALDFPDDLTSGPERFRYARWEETAFNRVYVAAGRNLAHDNTRADWVEPGSGKRPPEGQNAVLYEISLAFTGSPASSGGPPAPGDGAAPLAARPSAPCHPPSP